MAEKTGIAWTRSTFNPWIGCTKVSPGCDHCYAEVLDNRHRWKGATHWGVGVPRMRTSDANWNKVIGWQRKAAATGERWLVFCASLADVADKEVPAMWRSELVQLIDMTPALTWLLLTKRIGMVTTLYSCWKDALPSNVWLGASIVNQEEADRDLPKLLAAPARTRFISYEPALGPVDFKPFLWERSVRACAHETRRALGLPSIDWIIVGGESTQGAPARPFVIGWARDVMRQCAAARTAFFMKQFGSNATNREGVRHPFKDRAGADPAEWPEDLRVQEFPA